MSTRNDLHPDFGPSYGDGPNYGIPITVVGGKHRKVQGEVRVRQRERPGPLPARQRHPDRGRPPVRRRPARDHRGPVDLPAVRDLRDPHGARPVAGRLRRGVEPAQQPPASGHLDVRRRRRPADPARAAPLERGAGPRDQPRDPVHHRHHVHAPPLAGPARRRLAAVDRLPADGCEVPAEGELLHRAGTAPTPAR